MTRPGVLVLLAACAAKPPAVNAPRLAPGAPVERAIAAGQTHQYAIELPADSVLFAEVEQLGADVTLTTFGADGSQLGTFDSPTGAKGTEHVRIDAKRAGSYRVDVATFPGQTGSYRVRVVEIVPAREVAAREAKERAAIEKFFTDRQPFVEAFVAWAKQAAIGDDFAGIDSLIASARVVALGEADHGVREYLAYRNRLFEHLVEKQLVTALLVESGFTEATLADDYVMGAPGVTSHDAAAALFMWAMPAVMQDNIALLDWLRAYNAKAARKIRIYGVDLPGGRNGLFTDSRVAVDAALAYLAKAAPAAHGVLVPRLTPLLPSFSVAGYLALDAAHRTELRSAVETLLDAFKTLPDSAEMRRARQHAAMAVVVETFLRTTADRSTKQDLADASLDGIRDATMAANAVWAINEEGANSRVFLFAANAHIRRAPPLVFPSTIKVAAMGEYLARSLKDKYVAIGFVHGDGPLTPTLDGLFSKVGPPSFLVDLRTAPETVHAGLDQSWDLRLDGFRALGLKPAWSTNPLRCYDALAFTATSSAEPLAK